MNRPFKLFLVFFTGFSILSASALDRRYISPFEWDCPEIEAQGGSFVANGSGFGSLLVNPASFAKYREKKTKTGEIKKSGELTILSLTNSFAGDLFNLSESMNSSGNDMVKVLLNEVTGSGLGTSVFMGSGYVGRGFGFGLLSKVMFDAPPAETSLGVTGNLMWTTGFIAGYAHPFQLGPVKLVVGGDIRPMYRIFIEKIDAVDVLNVVQDSGSGLSLSSVDAFKGWAIAVDAGIDLSWKSLTASIVTRDIGNTYFFFKGLKSFAGTDFSGKDPAFSYITPWSMSFGLAYHPLLGRVSKFVDPQIHASFYQPLIKHEKLLGFQKKSPWTRLDFGAEILLLSSVALRAGFHGGYFTAGVGLDLFFVELNGALYSRELGSYAGDSRQMGASLELAFRF